MQRSLNISSLNKPLAKADLLHSLVDMPHTTKKRFLEDPPLQRLIKHQEVQSSSSSQFWDFFFELIALFIIDCPARLSDADR